MKKKLQPNILLIATTKYKQFIKKQLYYSLSVHNFFNVSLLFILFFCCTNMAIGQNCKQYFWVTPNDSSAYPIDNTITGNAELNQMFEMYGIEEYYFLGDLYLHTLGRTKPIYEIVTNKEGNYFEASICRFLENPYLDLFNFVYRPYQCYNNYKAHVLIRFIDNSARPCSDTRSCNEELNAIMDHYNVLGYGHVESLGACWGRMRIDRTDFVGLYNELSSLSHLVDKVGAMYDPMCCVYEKSGNSDTEEQQFMLNTYLNLLLENGYDPCEVGVPDNPIETVIVSPNPVHDYLSISGINPQCVTLYDWQGKIVLVETSQMHTIDLQHLQRGLYLLHIISDAGNVYVNKIIKE